MSNNYFDGYEEDETTEAHERRIVRCTSCRARIIFLTTEAGRVMPIDADTVEAKDLQYDHKKHVSHFATCTNPAKHRKPKEKVAKK